MTFTKLKNPSSWRRLSIATWRAPDDPTVYGTVDIEFSAALDFLNKYNQNKERKATVTHLMIKAMAKVFEKYPDLNGIISRRRIYLRKHVDIFAQVAIEATDPTEKPDLSGVKIESCETKTIDQIAEDMAAKAKKIRKKEDEQFESTKGIMNYLPVFLLPWVLKFISFLMYTCGISLEKLGMPYDPFGSLMITSVGSLGVSSGFAPLVPFSRVPAILCVGAVELKPWVIDGKVEARPVIDLSFTVDHRFIDGLNASKMLKYLKEILANPEKHLT